MTGALSAYGRELQFPPAGECRRADPLEEAIRYPAADGVRKAADELAAVDPAYRIGSFLPAEPDRNRRLANGTIVAGSSRGSSTLIVTNSKGAADTHFSVVPVGKSAPVVAFYVRGGAKVTVDIPAGTHEFFLASGEDWDAGRTGFTRGCVYTKIDKKYAFSSGTYWEMELAVDDGNVGDVGVAPENFPG